MPANSVKSSLIRFIRVTLLNLCEPARMDFKASDARSPGRAIRVSARPADRRVSPAAPENITSKQSNTDQKKRDTPQTSERSLASRRLEAGSAIKRDTTSATDKPTQHRRRRAPNPLAQNRAHNVRPLRAKRDANPDLVCALAYQVRNHSVDSKSASNKRSKANSATNSIEKRLSERDARDRFR